MNSLLLTSWALSGIYSCIVHNFETTSLSWLKNKKTMESWLLIFSWVWEEINYLAFMYKLWSLKRMLIFMDARNTTEAKIQA